MIRARTVIGLLAIVLAGCISSCARDRSVRVEVSELTPAGTYLADKVGRTRDLSAELRHGEAALAALRRTGDAGPTAIRGDGAAGAVDEIAERISDSLTEWEQYCADLTSAPRMQRSPAEAVGQTAPESVSDPGVSAETLAIRRKYSADYTNWHMRVSLLESHLAAAREQDRKLWSDKLEQAKTRQKAVDAECRAEIRRQQEQAAEAARLESQAELPADDPGSAGPMDGRPTGVRDRSIMGPLGDLRARTAKEPESRGRTGRSSDSRAYLKALDETRSSIERARMLLQQPEDSVQ